VSSVQAWCLANAFHSRPKTLPVNDFRENLFSAFYQDRLTTIGQPILVVLGVLGGPEVLQEGDGSDSDRRTCPALACRRQSSSHRGRSGTVRWRGAAAAVDRPGIVIMFGSTLGAKRV